MWTTDGSATRSVVNKMYIPDGKSHDSNFPFDTNGHVEGVVIKKDGAAAWVFSSSGASTIVQGQDRKNHPPDQLSDDTKDAVGSSLKSGKGHEIHWKYTDGTAKPIFVHVGPELSGVGTKLTAGRSSDSADHPAAHRHACVAAGEVGSVAVGTGPLSGLAAGR